MINKQEIINQIAEAVLKNPDMLAAMTALMTGVGEPEEAVAQKPDMMYVLTQKIKVKTDDENEVYHYHPVVGETLLIPGCTCNKMMSSANLLELQQSLGAMIGYCGCNADTYQILAMKPEEYDRLQKILDKTVTAIIENTQKAVDAFLMNAGYVGQNAISFESVYERIMTEMMNGAHNAIGAALGADSGIIENIDGVQYEHKEPCCCCCDDDDYEDEDEDYEDDGEDEPLQFPNGLYSIHRIN